MLDSATLQNTLCATNQLHPSQAATNLSLHHHLQMSSLLGPAAWGGLIRQCQQLATGPVRACLSGQPLFDVCSGIVQLAEQQQQQQQEGEQQNAATAGLGPADAINSRLQLWRQFLIVYKLLQLPQLLFKLLGARKRIRDWKQNEYNRRVNAVLAASATLLETGSAVAIMSRDVREQLLLMANTAAYGAALEQAQQANELCDGAVAAAQQELTKLLHLQAVQGSQQRSSSSSSPDLQLQELSCNMLRWWAASASCLLGTGCFKQQNLGGFHSAVGLAVTLLHGWREPATRGTQAQHQALLHTAFVVGAVLDQHRDSVLQTPAVLKLLLVQLLVHCFMLQCTAAAATAAAGSIPVNARRGPNAISSGVGSSSGCAAPVVKSGTARSTTRHNAPAGDISSSMSSSSSSSTATSRSTITCSSATQGTTCSAGPPGSAATPHAAVPAAAPSPAALVAYTRQAWQTLQGWPAELLDSFAGAAAGIAAGRASMRQALGLSSGLTHQDTCNSAGSVPLQPDSGSSSTSAGASTTSAASSSTTSHSSSQLIQGSGDVSFAEIPSPVAPDIRVAGHAAAAALHSIELALRASVSCMIYPGTETVAAALLQGLQDSLGQHGAGLIAALGQLPVLVQGTLLHAVSVPGLSRGVVEESIPPAMVASSACRQVIQRASGNSTTMPGSLDALPQIWLHLMQQQLVALPAVLAAPSLVAEPPTGRNHRITTQAAPYGAAGCSSSDEEAGQQQVCSSPEASWVPGSLRDWVRASSYLVRGLIELNLHAPAQPGSELEVRRGLTAHMHCVLEAVIRVLPKLWRIAVQQPLGRTQKGQEAIGAGVSSGSELLPNLQGLAAQVPHVVQLCVQDMVTYLRLEPLTGLNGAADVIAAAPAGPAGSQPGQPAVVQHLQRQHQHPQLLWLFSVAVSYLKPSPSCDMQSGADVEVVWLSALAERVLQQVHQKQQHNTNTPQPGASTMQGSSSLLGLPWVVLLGRLLLRLAKMLHSSRDMAWDLLAAATNTSGGVGSSNTSSTCSSSSRSSSSSSRSCSGNSRGISGGNCTDGTSRQPDTPAVVLKLLAATCQVAVCVAKTVSRCHFAVLQCSQAVLCHAVLQAPARAQQHASVQEVRMAPGGGGTAANLGAQWVIDSTGATRAGCPPDAILSNSSSTTTITTITTSMLHNSGRSSSRAGMAAADALIDSKLQGIAAWPVCKFTPGDALALAQAAATRADELEALQQVGSTAASTNGRPANTSATGASTASTGSSSSSSSSSSCAVSAALSGSPRLSQVMQEHLAAICAASSPIECLSLLLGGPSLQAAISQLHHFGSTITSLAPCPWLCNNPDCTNLSCASELLLVGRGACVCGGCKTARYCGQPCQAAHWPQHKQVCSIIRREGAADAAVK